MATSKDAIAELLAQTSGPSSSSSPVLIPIPASSSAPHHSPSSPLTNSGSSHSSSFSRTGSSASLRLRPKALEEKMALEKIAISMHTFLSDIKIALDDGFFPSDVHDVLTVEIDKPRSPFFKTFTVNSLVEAHDKLVTEFKLESNRLTKDAIEALRQLANQKNATKENESLSISLFYRLLKNMFFYADAATKDKETKEFYNFVEEHLSQLIPAARYLLTLTDKLQAQNDKYGKQWLAFIRGEQGPHDLRLSGCDLQDKHLNYISYTLFDTFIRNLSIANNPKINGDGFKTFAVALSWLSTPIYSLDISGIALAIWPLSELVPALKQGKIQRLALNETTRVLLTTKKPETLNMHFGFDVIASPARLTSSSSPIDVQAPPATPTSSSSPIDVPASPATPTSSSTPSIGFYEQLNRALKALYWGLKVHIERNFFPVTRFLGLFGGGIDVIVDGQKYNTPDTIAYLFSKLNVFEAETIELDPQTLNVILGDITRTARTKVSDRSAGQDAITALCYRLLADTPLLAAKMDERHGKAVLIVRLAKLASYLQTMKTLLQRLEQSPTNNIVGMTLRQAIKGEQVTLLDFIGCDLSAAEMGAIAYALPSMSVETLSLNGNEKIHEGVPYLAKVLPYVTGLKTVRLMGVTLEQESRDELLHAFSHPSCEVTHVAVNDAALQQQLESVIPTRAIMKISCPAPSSSWLFGLHDTGSVSSIQQTDILAHLMGR